MINRLFIDYPYFVKQNPVKINSADPVDTIMSMDRYEMEKLFMSVVRKDAYAWASRNGDPKYKADRRIRDVEKHLDNHFKNERDLMDTLVYFVEEGAIVPTKKSMTSNKSNGDGITMSRRFTIRASTDSRDYSENDIKREIKDLAYDLGVAVDFHEKGKFDGHYRYLVDLVFDIYDGADIIDTCGILIRNDEPKTYVSYGNLKRSIQCLTLDKALDFIKSYIREIAL